VGSSNRKREKVVEQEKAGEAAGWKNLSFNGVPLNICLLQRRQKKISGKAGGIRGHRAAVGKGHRITREKKWWGRHDPVPLTGSEKIFGRGGGETKEERRTEKESKGLSNNVV